MLSKNSIDGLIEGLGQYEDAEKTIPKWSYWRDSGSVHSWRTHDGNWLLQLSHEDNVVAMTSVGDQSFEFIRKTYDDDHELRQLLMLFLIDTESVYNNLKDTLDGGPVTVELSMGN